MAEIVIAGGSGNLGRLLIPYFHGRDIAVLTRSPYKVSAGVRFVPWDGKTLGEWKSELEHASVVINLAGRSIDCRFTKANRREILASRVQSTLALGEAIAQCQHPPRLWINAGGTSIFGHSREKQGEADRPSGIGFLADVSREWEAAFERSIAPATRKVLLRISGVLLREGGMLEPLIRFSKLAFGNRIGDGEQYLSWIHEIDFVRIIEWIIVNENISGTVHACSPNPVNNQHFMQVIGEALGGRHLLPIPKWLAVLGAWLIGTNAALILDGNKVVSKRLSDAGFEFVFPELEQAIWDIIT